MNNILKLLGRTLGYLLKTVTVGWIGDARDILKRLWVLIKKICSRQKLPHPEKEGEARCVSTTHPSVHRPDPCIYSQSYLLEQGLPVTWDNPDIVIKKGGVVVPEGQLQPNTRYDVEATIWNNSYDAPVVAMRVDVSFLTFGVGTTTTPIGSAFVDIGVKGSLKHPGKITVPWLTPPGPGHYCIQVAFTWVDDANPKNNLGQNNCDVVAATSPAHFEFQLRNAFDRKRHFTFTVDTYRLPELDPCDEVPRPKETRKERIRRMAALHGVDVDIPSGWTVVVTPDAADLIPNEEITVSVDATPPPGFVGEQTFNVNTFADGNFAGGVTLVATKA